MVLLALDVDLALLVFDHHRSVVESEQALLFQPPQRLPRLACRLRVVKYHYDYLAHCRLLRLCLLIVKADGSPTIAPPGIMRRADRSCGGPGTAGPPPTPGRRSRV